MTGITLAGIIVFLLAIVEVFISLAKEKVFLSVAGCIFAFVVLLQILVRVM